MCSTPLYGQTYLFHITQYSLRCNSLHTYHIVQLDARTLAHLCPSCSAFYTLFASLILCHLRGIWLAKQNIARDRTIGQLIGVHSDNLFRSLLSRDALCYIVA